MDETTTIKLQSSEGRVFTIAKDAARCIARIRDMLDDNPGVIVLDQVDDRTLAKVIQWVTRYKEEILAQNWHADYVLLSEWDEAFFALHEEEDEGAIMLYKIIKAGDHLRIPHLSNAGCAAVAVRIRGGISA